MNILKDQPTLAEITEAIAELRLNEVRAQRKKYVFAHP